MGFVVVAADSDRHLGRCADLTQVMLNNPELTNLVYQIYNTWLVDFCHTHPERFAGLACVPNYDAKLPADDVRRAANLGLRGAELSVHGAIEPLWHPFWEPLWTAAEECQMSVAFHTTGTGKRPPADLDPKLLSAARASGLTQFQMATAECLSSVIFAAVLERHPGLKLVLGESGIGWIPYIPDRMDCEFEDQFQNLGLALKPSDCWHRPMSATYQRDRIGIKLREDVGVENVMWGSDYPHPDGIFPDSQAYLQAELGHLPERIRRKIVCENAARLYGFGAGLGTISPLEERRIPVPSPGGRGRSGWGREAAARNDGGSCHEAYRYAPHRARARSELVVGVVHQRGSGIIASRQYPKGG
jgi:uncharacterized protein